MRPTRQATQSLPSLTLRLATDRDAGSLARLAALDSASEPVAPVLLAELDGELAVAVSLHDLTAIADPFRPTAELRRLTVARARQLREPTAAPRRWRLPVGHRHARSWHPDGAR